MATKTLGCAFLDGASTGWQNWGIETMTKENMKEYIKRKGDPRRHCRGPLSQWKH